MVYRTNETPYLIFYVSMSPFQQFQTQQCQQCS
nr:MAG TPA_asm: hypothetical protein [Caudoviricetes sp.]